MKGANRGFQSMKTRLHFGHVQQSGTMMGNILASTGKIETTTHVEMTPLYALSFIFVLVAKADINTAIMLDIVHI